MPRSPYPRLAIPPPVSRWQVVDRVLAVVLFAAALVPAVLAGNIGLFLWLAIPIPFFWKLGRWSGLAFAVLAIPHYILLYVACDMINDRSSRFLHAYHEQYWIIVIYVLVRTVAMWMQHSDREIDALNRAGDDERQEAD